MSIFEEQRLKANFVNICDKDGLANLRISLEKLMDQTSDWPERQKEDTASAAAVSSVVEKWETSDHLKLQMELERLARKGRKELRDKGERELIVKLR